MENIRAFSSPHFSAPVNYSPKITGRLSPSRPPKAFDPVNIITRESTRVRETERFQDEGKLEGER